MLSGGYRSATFTDLGTRAAALEFEVDTIDVDKISAIDLSRQRFAGELLLGLRIVNGALDPSLCKPGEVVTTDDDGNLHASAAWYASKMEMANAAAYEMSDVNIVERGSDVFIWLKIMGEYCEPMELENYPFDIQALTFSLRLGCRVDGPFPARFITPKTVFPSVESIQPEGVEPIIHEYSVGANVIVEALDTGSKSRRFPRLNVIVLVKRRPAFALQSIALPVGVIAMMAPIQFLIPLTNVDGRLAVSLTLTLTVAAYKLAIASMVPNVGYLTLLDKYVLGCMLFIAVTVFEGGILGHIAMDKDRRGFAEGADSLMGFAMLVTFVVFHVWYGYSAVCPSREREAQGYVENTVASQASQGLNKLPAQSTTLRSLEPTSTVQDRRIASTSGVGQEQTTAMAKEEGQEGMDAQGEKVPLLATESDEDEDDKDDFVQPTLHSPQVESEPEPHASDEARGGGVQEGCPPASRCTSRDLSRTTSVATTSSRGLRARRGSVTGLQDDRVSRALRIRTGTMS